MMPRTRLAVAAGAVLAIAALSACTSLPEGEPESRIVGTEQPAEILADEVLSDEEELVQAAWFFTDRHVRVGYMQVGGDRAFAPLRVRELDGNPTEGPLEIVVHGEFAVDGLIGPLDGHEERVLTVRYTGPVTYQRIVHGWAQITIDGDTRRIALSAAVGDAELPEVTWYASPLGMSSIFSIRSAPFPHKDSRHTTNAVLVFIPRGFDVGRDYGIITHFHGHRAELRRTLTEQELLEQVVESRRQAVFIAPQGPVDQPDGYFGRLQEINGFRELVEDVVIMLYRDELVRRPLTERIVLTAHSGGYRPIASVLAHGGLGVDEVHLFDALYGAEETYREFVLRGGRLRSVYTEGTTALMNGKLRWGIARMGYVPSADLSDAALRGSAVTIARTRADHAACITQGRTYARWLQHSVLPPVPDDSL